MTAYGKYKQAMITAITIIMLCIISLTGATWAIFTSDEADGTIGINVSSGKVKLNIVDDAGVSLLDSFLLFDDPDADGYVRFEPGATFYTQSFQIVNIGTVPVKYRMYVSDDDSIDSQILLDSFDFMITTDVNAISGANDMKSFEGELELNEISDKYYLVVHMKESAGNELIGKSYKGIGITVYAVQGNANLE